MAVAKHRDKYQSFEMLCRAEPPRAFRIDCRLRPSTAAIIAPHGGKIERWTSAIAAAVASNDYNLYRFEGLKRRDNRDLHITSARFDEPQCLALISNCDWVVAVHGCRGGHRVVYLGGLDVALGEAIRDQLEANAFTVGTHEDPELQGTHPNNVCNRGRRRCGVQLELPYGFRSALMARKAGALVAFVAAVRKAIESMRVRVP